MLNTDGISILFLTADAVQFVRVDTTFAVKVSLFDDVLSTPIFLGVEIFTLLFKEDVWCVLVSSKISLVGTTNGVLVLIE